jgi:hypothetical protein
LFSKDTIRCGRACAPTAGDSARSHRILAIGLRLRGFANDLAQLQFSTNPRTKRSSWEACVLANRDEVYWAQPISVTCATCRALGRGPADKRFAFPNNPGGTGPSPCKQMLNASGGRTELEEATGTDSIRDSIRSNSSPRERLDFDQPRRVPEPNYCNSKLFLLTFGAGQKPLDSVPGLFQNEHVKVGTLVKRPSDCLGWRRANQACR